MKRRRSWGWLVYFVVLSCLVITGVTLPIVYNLGIQLRPEQVQQARKRWRENGPMDYDLTYSAQFDREPKGERHIVFVRGGRVVYSSYEGHVGYLAPALAALQGLPAGGLTDRWPSKDVPGLFDHIEKLMDERPPGRQDYLVAVFDPKNGYPRRFIWRVRGTSQREEWNVRMWGAGELK